jgi:hypothetical protein
MLPPPTEDFVTISISVTEIIEYQNIIAVRKTSIENLRPLGVSTMKRIVSYKGLVWGKRYDITIRWKQMNAWFIIHSGIH